MESDARSDGPVELRLRVDDEGRLAIPEAIRERLGIESDSEVQARVDDDVLSVGPRPSSRIRTASVDRDDWSDSTPTDAGEALFGDFD